MSYVQHTKLNHLHFISSKLFSYWESEAMMRKFDLYPHLFIIKLKQSIKILPVSMDLYEHWSSVIYLMRFYLVLSYCIVTNAIECRQIKVFSEYWKYTQKTDMV